jgi:hypothetical protein
MSRARLQADADWFHFVDRGWARSIDTEDLLPSSRSSCLEQTHPMLSGWGPEALGARG